MGTVYHQRSLLAKQRMRQDVSADKQYDEAALVLDVSPRAGSVRGGTAVVVSGSGFADGVDYKCSFGGRSVPATYAPSYGVLSCVSPSGVFGRRVAVEVSLNAQQYTTDAHLFQFYSVPTVSSLSPNTGPVLGGTRVLVHGLAFANGGGQHRCRFGRAGREAEDAVVNATRHEPSGSIVSARSPPRPRAKPSGHRAQKRSSAAAAAAASSHERRSMAGFFG